MAPSIRFPRPSSFCRLRIIFLFLFPALCYTIAPTSGLITTSSSAAAFCNDYSHLSLCQLRQKLADLGELGPLLESTIGEIAFLAGEVGEPGMSDSVVGPALQKRAKVSLADPMLIQLASLPSTRSGPGGGPNSWLGGILRQKSTAAGGGGSRTLRPSSGSLRLVRMSAGQNAAGGGQGGRLLRQLFRMT